MIHPALKAAALGGSAKLQSRNAKRMALQAYSNAAGVLSLNLG